MSAARRLFVATLCVLVGGLVFSGASAWAAPPEAGDCPNEQLRAEQPYGLGLPDCRAYEMVSPVEKNDYDAVDAAACVGTEWGSRAAVSGEALVFVSPGSFGNAAGSRLCDAYLSGRGPDGWSTRSITPPRLGLEALLGGANESAFGDMYFTPDLSKGLVTEQTTPLTSETPEGSASMYVADFAAGTYQLVESQPDNNEHQVAPRPVGASTDLSHVLLEDTSEWVDGRTIAAGIGNHGESLGAEPGSGNFSSAGIGGPGDTWHSMSSDGKRIFMTTISSTESRENRDLYVRENAEQPQSPVDGQGRCTVAEDACTIELSASRKTNGTGPGGTDPNAPYPARYWGASADGSKVFFTDKVELTNDAYTGPEDNRPNLYEYDLENEELTDLTVDTTDAKGADVLGVTEISEDGSYVYFVAKGKLAEGATAGQPNLYVSHDGGELTFIATLVNGKLNEEIEESGDDELVRTEIEETVNPSPEGDVPDWSFVPEGSHAAVSQDGAELAFVSEGNPTGYDNEPVEPNACKGPVNHRRGPVPCREVYLYDATTNSLACASCDPSGARPPGPSSLNNVNNGRQIQAKPRNFSEDGSRLFFQSDDALVPHDSNGRQDVYEYEGGHVYPISNAAGGYDSYFLDASANGEDVFIATPDQLLPEDRDLRIDIYDARVGGGFPVSVSPAVCSNGDSCKPPPTPQPGVFGAPASVTFSGAGNPVPVVAPETKGKVAPRAKRCGKGFVKKRGVCVRRKAKRHGVRSKRRGK